MIKALLGALLLIAGGLQGPSVQWKPEVKQADGVWQVVLTGQIGDNYYIHPMADPYTGVTLEVEETDTVLRLGLPYDKYEPSDYKGEKVAEGEYVITQNLELQGTGKVSVSGTVSWLACSGDF